MRGLLAGLIGLALSLLGPATPTWAQGARQGTATADLMTVSGRQGLPAAMPGSPLAGRLAIGEIGLAPETATTLRFNPETTRAELRQALSRSLSNHGYLATPPTDATPLSIEIGSAKIQAEGTATIAAVDFAVHAPTSDPAAACLSYVTTGTFRALSPIGSGGGERTTAVIATVLLGMVGAAPGALLTDQFRNADAENALLNRERTMLPGEAVTPRGQPAAQFAGRLAVREAIAAYVLHLSSHPACTAPLPGDAHSEPPPAG